MGGTLEGAAQVRQLGDTTKAERGGGKRNTKGEKNIHNE